MSNGHVCCILAVCCPDNDDGRAQALAEEMTEALEMVPSKAWMKKTADWIIANFDLVPKGVGAAIVKAYAPEFAKVKRLGEKPISGGGL